MPAGLKYNSPPNWPDQPNDWEPPPGWQPDPTWPPAPAGWLFWTPSDTPRVTEENPVNDPPSVADGVALPTEPISTDSPDVDGETPTSSNPLAELESTKQLLAKANEELNRLQSAQGSVASASEASSDLVDLDDERVLQEVGIYRYHHPLENSAEYRDKLDELQGKIKDSVKSGNAILTSNMFTFDNSLAKGRRMTNDLSKLMLRAYNAEADNCVRSLRAGNILTAKKRLEASVTAIARLGAMMEMRVSPSYHALRIEELELTSDFLMKVQEEREQAREERERLREERRVAAELAAERERLDKEREHHLNAIEALRAKGDEDGANTLMEQLKSIDEAIAHNDYRAANIRCGCIYVISNEGAFGKGVVKIGLTRRLQPDDRIRELSGASVPFPFDIHALFFSEDAVTLETQLHHAFADRRLNHVNERKKFFFATPHDVRVVLAEKVGNLLEFTEQPEATQFLQSRGFWSSIEAAH